MSTEIDGDSGAISLYKCGGAPVCAAVVQGEKPDRPFLSCDCMREFWITVDTVKNVITLGRAGEVDALLIYNDPEDFPKIKYFGFRTNREHVGLFYVSEPQRPGCKYEQVCISMNIYINCLGEYV